MDHVLLCPITMEIKEFKNTETKDTGLIVGRKTQFTAYNLKSAQNYIWGNPLRGQGGGRLGFFHFPPLYQM